MPSIVPKSLLALRLTFFRLSKFIRLWFISTAIWPASSDLRNLNILGQTMVYAAFVHADVASLSRQYIVNTIIIIIITSCHVILVNLGIISGFVTALLKIFIICPDHKTTIITLLTFPLYSLPSDIHSVVDYLVKFNIFIDLRLAFTLLLNLV
jgi:hypothetical protein